MRSVRSFIPLIRGTLAASGQRVAHLGDFLLESGERIKNCQVGYRTFGRLNPSKSNAVILTPWFQGTSAQLAWQIGPGKLVDSSKYFVIAVDAFGNGTSSSPSNSGAQPGAGFPSFTIRDIVESQFWLVTRVFGLTHLMGAVGISMGGMQVFQWMTAYPDFMDKAVSIVGSPQTQPGDRTRWERDIANLQAHSAWTRGWQALLQAKPRTVLHELRIKRYDHARQGQAIMTFDIAAPFGGSMTRAAATMRAELLVAGTWTDREVNPQPAFELGRMVNAEILELDGRCGHQAPSCEQKTLWRAVGRFLAGHRENLLHS
jgi:homoserine O-acetyltransferase